MGIQAPILGTPMGIVSGTLAPHVPSLQPDMPTVLNSPPMGYPHIAQGSFLPTPTRQPGYHYQHSLQSFQRPMGQQQHSPMAAAASDTNRNAETATAGHSPSGKLRRNAQKDGNPP